MELASLVVPRLARQPLYAYPMRLNRVCNEVLEIWHTLPVVVRAGVRFNSPGPHITRT